MLKQKFRLTGEKNFQRVFKYGRPASGKNFLIKFLKNYLFCPRFGLIVSNKVSKKATVRNKLKRRGREILKKWISQNPGMGIDTVIIFRKGAETKEFWELQKELQKVLSRQIPKK